MVTLVAMESSEDVNAQFAEGSLADEVLRDPDGFGERLREYARAEAEQWFEKKLARRMAERQQ